MSGQHNERRRCVMVWTEGIKAEMLKNKLNQEAVAKKLGISATAFSNKLLGYSEFKASEVYKLATMLNLRGQYDEYFFRQEME